MKSYYIISVEKLLHQCYSCSVSKKNKISTFLKTLSIVKLHDETHDFSLQQDAQKLAIKCPFS
jgi:hypothetical protein